jgi:hypothetical protein
MTSLNTFVAGSPVESAIRELDQRKNDGIDVPLFWESQSNPVWCFVEDERSGESLRFGVAADALEAFHHPYFYAYGDHGRSRRAAAAGAVEAR